MKPEFCMNDDCPPYPPRNTYGKPHSKTSSAWLKRSVASNRKSRLEKVASRSTYYEVKTE